MYRKLILNLTFGFILLIGGMAIVGAFQEGTRLTSSGLTSGGGSLSGGNLELIGAMGQPAGQSIASFDGSIRLDGGLIRQPREATKIDSITFVDPTNGSGALVVGSRITINPVSLSGLPVALSTTSPTACSLSSATAPAQVTLLTAETVCEIVATTAGNSEFEETRFTRSFNIVRSFTYLPDVQVASEVGAPPPTAAPPPSPTPINCNEDREGPAQEGLNDKVSDSELGCLNVPMNGYLSTDQNTRAGDVYRFTVSSNSNGSITLNVPAGANYDLNLFELANAANNTATFLAKSDSGGVGATESLTFSFVPGKTYFIQVARPAGQPGSTNPYVLTISAP